MFSKQIYPFFLKENYDKKKKPHHTCKVRVMRLVYNNNNNFIVRIKDLNLNVSIENTKNCLIYKIN